MFASLAKHMRVLLPHACTSGDFVRLRYEKVEWRVFLLISLFYGFGWLFSLGVAGGVFIGSLLPRIVIVIRSLPWLGEFEWSQLQHSDAKAKGVSQ